jgi:predicted nucleotidyltransferase
MHPVIESQLREKAADLSAACRRFGVERLDLFGSAVTGAFDPESSDLDFLVEFDPSARNQAFDNYFGLKEQLKSLFSFPVELVTRRSLRNPILIDEVERNRTPVYAASP